MEEKPPRQSEKKKNVPLAWGRRAKAPQPWMALFPGTTLAPWVRRIRRNRSAMETTSPEGLQGAARAGATTSRPAGASSSAPMGSATAGAGNVVQVDAMGEPALPAAEVGPRRSSGVGCR